MGTDYILDLGINRLEVDKQGNTDFWYSSRVIDQGDLSTYYGYETLDANGLSIKQGKVYPKTLATISDVKQLDLMQLLREGYTYLRLEKIPLAMLESPIPLNLVGSTYELPKLQLQVGINPTFLLEKNGKPVYVVINGFLFDLSTGKGSFKNAMIYR